MKEWSDILKQFRHFPDEAYALATVIKVRGSAYRKPGARMLIHSDGRTVGTISGGCLEGEVIAQALDVIETGERRLLPFEMGEDDHLMGFGSGCGGDVHVLIEPLNALNNNGLVALEKVWMERQPLVLATVIQVPPIKQTLLGHRVWIEAEGRCTGDLKNALLQSFVLKDAPTVLASARPLIKRYPMPCGEIEVLFEVLQPPVQLVVFGENHDVSPVIGFGSALGWHTVVVGRKPLEMLRARFPEADECHFLMHPEEAQTVLRLDARTAIVLMTHSFLRDEGLLNLMRQTPVRYIGALGPKHRTAKMLEDLQLAWEDLPHVFAPVGLDIGTESPQEIGLSVIAEIQSVFSNRRGGALKHRTSAIHEAVEVE